MYELFIVVSGGEYESYAIGRWDEIMSIRSDMLNRYGVRSFVKEM